ncbi:MAG TPA: hypothetical protein VMM54_04005, partial [Nitrospirota bacterium]|nr:hypothetical protein [Nitrospirota bacterium]
MLIFQHRPCRMTVAAFGAALAFVLAIPPSSWAHGVAGQRFFPTTFAVDDPFISDEFSVLYHSNLMNDETGGPRIQNQSIDVG